MRLSGFNAFNTLWEGLVEADATSTETEDLLEELQKAAEQHQQILLRQAELIRRLRQELKDVKP